MLLCVGQWSCHFNPPFLSLRAVLGEHNWRTSAIPEHVLDNESQIYTWASVSKKWTVENSYESLNVVLRREQRWIFVIRAMADCVFKNSYCKISSAHFLQTQAFLQFFHTSERENSVSSPFPARVDLTGSRNDDGNTHPHLDLKRKHSFYLAGLPSSHMAKLWGKPRPPSMAIADSLH